MFLGVSLNPFRHFESESGYTTGPSGLKFGIILETAVNGDAVAAEVFRNVFDFHAKVGDAVLDILVVPVDDCATEGWAKATAELDWVGVGGFGGFGFFGHIRYQPIY